MARNLALFGFLASLLACSPKSGGNGPDATANNAPNQQTASTNSDPSAQKDNGDDDFQVAAAVPMALVDGEYLAQAETKLTPSLANGGYSAPSSRSSTDNDPTDNQYAVALGILEAPGRAGGELKDLLANSQTLMQSLFSASGAFKGGTVDIQKGTTQRIYKLSDGGSGPQYAVVYVNDAKAAYQYGVDLYTAVSSGATKYQRRTEIEFTPEGTSDAKVHLQQATPVTQPAVVMERIDATYDTKASSIQVSYGYETAPDTAPAKTVAALDFDGTGATVRGAYVWKRSSPPPTGLLPRYYDVQTGDIELFMERGRLTATGETAQEVAFIPASAAAVAGTDPGTQAFTTYAYPGYMLAFLNELVRNSSLDPTCSTAGDAFRSAFTGKTAPDSVTNAPSDLCEDNGAVTDASVEQLIGDTCNAGVDIVLPVDEAGSATPVNYSLCTRYEETQLLANPQYLYTDSGARKLVTAPNKPSSVSLQVYSELQKVKFLDISALSTIAWPALPEKTAADFAKAEALP